MVINLDVESEKKIRTITATVQPERGIRHTRTFMGMLGGNTLINMYGLGSIFQAVDNKYMLVEELEEYVLASVESA